MAQLELTLSAKPEGEPCVSFVVEGASHHLYEIRIHRLHQRGDVSAAAGFEIAATQLDEEEGEAAGRARAVGATTAKRVRFEDGGAGAQEAGTSAQREALHFFEKFQALNLYYQQVNQRHGGGVAPSFYRFRLCPLGGPLLNRVYEVEEHVGRCFLEEVAEMHLAHQRLMQHAQGARALDWQGSLAVAREEQKSLPAFIVGRLIALLCKKLEAVQCSDQAVLEGAGELVLSRQSQGLRGSVRNLNNYFAADRDRYSAMLASMRARWYLYLSNLETEIIEEKLEFILDSLTFKYTRQPGLLSLIPDRMTAGNLRVASTVKLHNTAAAEAAQDGGARPKFYKDVYSDPNRSADLREALDSVLHAVSQPSLERPAAWEDPDASRAARSTASSDAKYTVTKHVCVAGVEPAKRPKYQLIASLLYLVDFHLRKVSRRPELFAGKHTQDADKAYDHALDAMLTGIKENYGDDEVNHVLDLVQLRRGGQDSLLEAVLRAKLEKQLEAGDRRKAIEEVRKRARRNDASTSYLEMIHQEHDYVVGRDMQEIAVLQKYLNSRSSQTMSGAEDDQFRKLLSQTKSKLGSNSSKLAEEFILKTRLEAERRLAGKASI